MAVFPQTAQASKIQNKNWPLNSALPESSKHSLSYLSPSDFSSRMILE